jgi:hypothetical protein
MGRQLNMATNQRDDIGLKTRKDACGGMAAPQIGTASADDFSEFLACILATHSGKVAAKAGSDQSPWPVGRMPNEYRLPMTRETHGHSERLPWMMGPHHDCNLSPCCYPGIWLPRAPTRGQQPETSLTVSAEPDLRSSLRPLTRVTTSAEKWVRLGSYTGGCVSAHEHAGTSVAVHILASGKHRYEHRQGKFT